MLSIGDAVTVFIIAPDSVNNFITVFVIARNRYRSIECPKVFTGSKNVLCRFGLRPANESNRYIFTLRSDNAIFWCWCISVRWEGYLPIRRLPLILIFIFFIF